MSKENKESLLVTSPIRPIEQISTVCVGKPNAVSPHPTHSSPVGSSGRELPPEGDGRPGIPLPLCADRSGYGPDCVGCIKEQECEEIERSIYEKFMADMTETNGGDLMADKVQIWNPKGMCWTLIDRELGQIVDHSPGKFLDVPIFTHKSVMESCNGNLPLPQFPPEVVIEECSFEQSGYTTRGNHWNVPTLLKAANDQHCLVFDLPLSAIDLSACPWKDTQSVEDIIYHANRAYKSDLKYPIILDWHGYICDGWHRVVKAVILQHKTIRAYRLKKYVEPDFIKEGENAGN
ncbi:MAG: hypothetical protein PVG39_00100 [Desulfobacteraceae bacterium]